MAKGADVRPGKWQDVIDLYDDGDFSAVWGRYDGDPKRSLGVRWNEGGQAGQGYPVVFGHPQWFVVPDTFVEGFLRDMLTAALSKPSQRMYKENILTALSEFENRIHANCLHHVFALANSSNCGKSMTLRRLAVLLLERGGKVVAVEPEVEVKIDLDIDIKVSIDYKGKRIGISTGGDYADIIDDAWDFFRKWNVDIAFTAMRKRCDASSTMQVRRNAGAADILLTEIAKPIEGNPNEYDKANKTLAESMAGEIDKL